MRILQTNTFKKVAKKLHPNQKDCLDKAIRIILSDPLVGIEKVGDLSNIRVYKFRMIEQHAILAYMYNQQEQSIILLALGSCMDLPDNARKKIIYNSKKIECSHVSGL